MTIWGTAKRKFFECKRVGGLTFLKIGRLNVSFSLAKKSEAEKQEEKNSARYRKRAVQAMNRHNARMAAYLDMQNAQNWEYAE